MRDILLNPALVLKPPTNVEWPKAGKAMVELGELIIIARRLLQRGLLVPVQISDAPLVNGLPVTNGWFGVEKDKQGRKQAHVEMA